ncbi:MAG: helicase-associated domain-containing protein [Spirochaetia bacterium]
MRLFPPDWPTFLDALALWGELSISARRTFLDGLRPGLPLAASPGGLATEELKVAGLLEEAENPGYLTVAEQHEGFHHVMKALEKSPLFEGAGLAALCSYLGDHYTSRERSLLHESLALLPNDLPRVAGLVSSVEWLEAALPQNGAPGTPAGTAAGLAEARTMLRFFREQRDRVALRDLEDYFPTMGREDLCAGIRIGVQRAVFFLGLRRSDLEPLVGIWPAAARRLRRMAVVLAPEPVKAARTFRHPYLIDDMTTLLLAARVEPIPLRRGDEKPFIRFVEDVSPALLSVPEWLEGFTGLPPDGRISLALQALRLTGLVVPDGSPSTGAHRQGRRGQRGATAAPGSRHPRAPGGTAWREPALVPAPWSVAWMSQDLPERRERVVGMLAIGAGGPSGLFDLLEEEWTSSEGAREEILPWLVQAFSSVPTASFIRFADFAEYQAAMGSPLGAVQPSAAAGTGASSAATDPVGLGAAATEEALEELWKSFLGIFIGRCLLSLDGVEAGITDDGAPCFRLTHTGRRILGLPGDGHEEREGSDASGAAIIVQPNFEIVFLVPSPAAEALLGRFCERLGREVGVLFRITKQSVRRGAEAGLGLDQVMGPLTQYSRSELPPNVRQEVQGWFTARDAGGYGPGGYTGGYGP